jgi:hypothetical protein
MPRHPAVISRRSRAICSCACRVCLAIFEMADIHVQHINIKFCFKVEETFTETHEMVKNVYGGQCISCNVVMNGLSDLRTVGSQNKMSSVWDGPQRHVTTLMFRKLVKSCVLTVV